MKKLSIIFITFYLFSCTIESKKELNFKDVFFKTVENINVRKSIKLYGEELRKEFHLDTVQVAVFIYQRSPDSLGIQYIKIDSLNIEKRKIYKLCKNEGNIILFYLSDSNEINSSNYDCLTNKFSDKSTSIQDYYLKEMIVVRDSIVSNKVINIQNVKWAQSVVIDNKKFIPPIIKK